MSSLVMSKLTFGAGAWPPLPVGDMKLFSGAVFSLYRATLGLQHDADQRVTLAMICSLLGLPDHATILKLEQLRYLKQLCNDAPDAVWALLRQDDGYLGLLRDALLAFHAHTGDLHSPRPASSTAGVGCPYHRSTLSL